MKTNRYRPLPAVTMFPFALAATRPLRKASVERAAPYAPKRCTTRNRYINWWGSTARGLYAPPALRAVYARGALGQHKAYDVRL